MAFHLKIVSPTKVVFDEPIDKLNVVTSAGELTILPHHTPLISTLKKDGRISVFVKGNRKDFYATSGVLTVKEKETIIIVEKIVS